MMVPVKNFLVALLFVLPLYSGSQVQPWQNARLPSADRVKDLLHQLTVEEKASMLNNASPGVERLGIPAYDWWNEALHGVARAGLATSFPQPVGLAATFNTKAISVMGDITSDEARAKYNQFIKEGKHGLYQGLTFYSPNINIFRDPRWGRGHETFGEDPYLTGSMGVAFVKAMQGNDPNYFKTICTAKHFAVHSGPESSRHIFNAVPSKEDFWETYLPAFKMLAQDGRVYSFMCAYNRLYGEPCCSNPMLLSDILRKQWGFKGFIATDCGAVYDMFTFHGTAADSVEGMAEAVRAGVDNFCWGYGTAVIPALKRGLLTNADLDTAVGRLLLARMKLGMFDADSLHPWSKINYSQVNSQPHKEYALELARQSIVLLKNKSHVLPLSKNIKSLAVIGPNANDTMVPLGNYNGDPAHVVSALEGIKNRAGNKVKVNYVKGCHIIDTAGYDPKPDFEKAMAAAKESDVIVFVGGLSPNLEGEEMPVKVPGFQGGDKTNLDLPEVQTRLLHQLKSLGKPLILVLMNGSAISINWENDHLDAIMETWYGGEAAGTAIADVLFGDYNPAGRLPVTFYKSINDLPAFDDYRMDGRTYRYCTKPVLYPFGYGLSYTSFTYQGLKLDSKILAKSGEFTVSFQVTNTGNFAGDEVVQLYIHQQGNKAQKELKGFERMHLNEGETKLVTLKLPAKTLWHYDSKKDGLEVLPGKFDLMIGSSSADIKLVSGFEIK